jgi:hypothetical protein
MASRRRRKPETIVIFAVAAVRFLKMVTAFASPRHAKVPAASGSSSRESSPGFRTGCKNTGPPREGPVAFVECRPPWYDEVLVLVPKDRI